MNLISLLGLDSLLERWRANLNEAAIAAEDRVDLAQLEWQQHKRSMQVLAVLAIVLGALTVVVLIVLYKWSVKRTAKSDEDDTEAGGLVAAGGKA